MNTFTPFICNGQELALYSRDYTATRIMEIPSCKDLGGEEQHGAGFCPTDFFVPYYRYVEQYSKAKIDGKELGTFDFHLYGPEALDKEEWAMMIG
jgi:hypothetical protein